MERMETWSVVVVDRYNVKRTGVITVRAGISREDRRIAAESLGYDPDGRHLYASFRRLEG